LRVSASTANLSGMGTERFEYMVALDDGPESEVLGRLSDLDFAAAVYMAAVAKYPKRNIRMLQGERIIKRHDGEPAPVPKLQKDPNLKSWSVSLIGGRKMQHLGFVLAADAESAMTVAAEQYQLSPEKRKRLAVSPHR
jgi:hypothetical protein